MDKIRAKFTVYGVFYEVRFYKKMTCIKTYFIKGGETPVLGNILPI